MTSMIPEPVILKTDGRGRVRTPLAQREALLDGFERRGLSGMKCASLHGETDAVQRRQPQAFVGCGGQGFSFYK